MSVATAERRLETHNVSVTFGSTTVVKAVDLDVDRGEVVGLLGANGSGKSTMVKVLTGVYHADHGSQVVVNGKAAGGDGYGPLRARSLGVRVIHQEAPVIGALTVAEMIGVQLGFPTRGGLVRSRELTRRAEAILAACEVPVDPGRLAASLTAAERAMVSFATVIGDVDNEHALLILDEATASLSTADTARFLVRVRAAADEGLAVLMVTHRLDEVRQHCDRTVVLRNGEVVDRRESGSFDEREVVRAMVGDDSNDDAVDAGQRSAAGPPEHIRLSVRDLAGGAIRSADFDLAAGEILGITGRTDGGASDLLRLVAGIDPRRAGTITLDDGRALSRGPRAAVHAGVTYLSADRLQEGGISTMTVAENLVLPRVERYGLRGRGRRDDVDRMMRMLDVRPADPEAIFGTLSGGNQQKVLLGRWLLLNPRVLVLDDPTAGVDAHTREVLFEILRRLAGEGVGAIVRSTEPEQLARHCSRVLVMRDGQIAQILEGESVNTEEISLATYA